MSSITNLIHQKILESKPSFPILSLISAAPYSSLGNHHVAANELSQHFFPMATETIVLPADGLEAVTWLRNSLREKNELSALCLLADWEIIRKGPLRLLPLAMKAKGFLSVADVMLYETLETLPVGVQVLTLMPQSFLTDHTKQIVRDYLRENHTILWIIEHRDDPALHLHLHSSFQTCSLLLKTGLNTDSNLPIRLFQVPAQETNNADSLLSEIDQLNRQQGGRTANGYILRQKLPKHSRWAVAINDPRWGDKKADLSVLGSVTSLHEVAEILRCRPQAKQEAEKNVSKAHVITARYLRPDGKIDFHVKGRRQITDKVYESYIELLPGDIVIRQIHDFSRHEANNYIPLPVAQIAKQDDKTFYADHTVWVIRVNPPQSEVYSRMLFQYFCSERVNEWFRAHLSSLQINHTDLKALPVPKPDEDNLALWKQSSNLLAEIQSWQDELEEAQQNLFRQNTIEAGREQLVTNHLNFSQKVMAAKATGTLSWKIRNLYPHPLAYRWRLLETMSPSLDKFRESLKTAEFFTAFLAIMGIVLFENQLGGDLPGYIRAISDRLKDRWESGMSFGDWVEILKQTCTSRRLRNIGPHTPFFELTDFYDSDVEDKLNLLRTWRNDYAHFRDDELQDRFNEVEANLTMLFNRAEFLTKYPLHYITDTQFQIRQNRIRYYYQSLVGDHHLAAIEHKEGNFGYPLQKGALYFATPQNELYLISPWLVRATCPTCHTWETYCFDKISSTGDVVIKSLERGHSLRANYLREEFITVNLVPN